MASKKTNVNKVLHGPAIYHARMQENRFLEIAQLQLPERVFSQLSQSSKKRIQSFQTQVALSSRTS